MTMARGALTYRDLRHTPDDGQRWEVIDGEVYVSPAPSLRHQDVVLSLAVLLSAHVRRHRLGKVWVSPIEVALERPTGVQPDLVFISKARMAIAQELRVVGAPDLLVEVASPSTASRDRGIKLDAYARCGVAHYWMIDPRRGGLKAMRLEGGRYVVEAELGARGVFRPSLFPGLTLRMRDVLAG
ncbi:MAG: Uma2 family endonuclease [Deltaproteobacteria bacterium]|nr:Uma2 family endonuclease [Deltaproteobacteria bacterium]